MDPYRLAVFCIVFVCVVYWINKAALEIKRRRKEARERATAKLIKVVHSPNGHQYLIDGDVINHIPDPPTFEYLGSLQGFSWTDSKEIGFDEMKQKFTIGKQLPSIKLHFPKTEVR